MKKKKVLFFNGVEQLKDCLRVTHPSIPSAYVVHKNGLVDVTECWADFPEVHESPTILTAGVWKLIENAVKNPLFKDDHMDIIWDILFMNWKFGFSIGGNGNFFSVLINGVNTELVTIHHIQDGLRILFISTLDESDVDKELRPIIKQMAEESINQAFFKMAV